MFFGISGINLIKIIIQGKASATLAKLNVENIKYQGTNNSKQGQIDQLRDQQYRSKYLEFIRNCQNSFNTEFDIYFKYQKIVLEK